jgi:peptide/nickel transport system substrate-binding protein
LIGLLVLLTACGPQAAPSQSSGGQTAPAGAAPKKTVTIAIQREPTAFAEFGGAQSPVAGGASNVKNIVHDSLSIETAVEAYEAQLAEELPSLEKGTWRVNPDGTMQTTWKLRPNIKWHDGTPFTTDDVRFAFELTKDPDLARSRGSGFEYLDSLTIQDAQTFVVNWKTTFGEAYRQEVGTFVPRHLLEEAYRADKEAFTNSRLLSTQFVGLGPYKLTRWEQGSFIEFTRFDDYYRARPLLDSVIVRIVGDPNAMVANVLAGEVDVVLPVGVDVEAALEVKRRWEGTGNQVQADPTGRLRQLELQFRPEYARPRNGLPVRAVREALYRAIDRQSMVEVLTQGLAPVADSWIPPNHGLRNDLAASIPQYPYDPARAQQLLAQAGWAKGADGVLVHQPDGERFDIEIWANQGFGAEKEVGVVADNWKAVGVAAAPFFVPAARAGDREFEATHPGPFITNPSGNAFYDDRLHSKAVTGPENRWSGRNRAGYTNPKVDAILDRLVIAINPSERVDLHRQLLQEGMGDVVLMPTFWEVVPILALKGITGPKVVRNEATANFYLWDKRA